MGSHRSSRRRLRALLGVMVLSTFLTGCQGERAFESPGPADFEGVVASLADVGIGVRGVVSGDAGCDDRSLAQTAISFDAHGLDQASDVRIYLYVFRNRAAFERLRTTVATCAGSYVTDATGFESFDVSPYVVAGQGPWATTFRHQLRAALTKAAGTGG